VLCAPSAIAKHLAYSILVIGDLRGNGKMHMKTETEKKNKKSNWKGKCTMF